MGDQWRSAPGGGVVLDIYPGTQGGEPTIVRRMNPRVAQLDGAMLTAVGRPTAVNPDLRLRALARSYNWPVLDLR